MVAIWYLRTTRMILRMNVTGPGGGDELNRLLQSTGRNDQTAFAELYKRTSPKLFGYVCGCCATAAQPRKCCRKPTPRYGDARRPSTHPGERDHMLVALSRNKAIDRLRQHREELLDDPQNLMGPSTNSPPRRRTRSPARNIGGCSSAWMNSSHSSRVRFVKPFSAELRITNWRHAARCRSEP